MNLNKSCAICKQGVKLEVGAIGVADVCTGQAAKNIRDDVFLIGLMLNIQLELLEEMRGPDKTEVHLHRRHCRGDRRLLEDIQNA